MTSGGKRQGAGRKPAPGGIKWNYFEMGVDNNQTEVKIGVLKQLTPTAKE